MTDQALDILKLALLLLLYLFFARVLWAVWREVQAPLEPDSVTDTGRGALGARSPQPDAGHRPPRHRRSKRPTRLVVLEPRERRGTTFGVTDGLGIGRDADNTVVITGDDSVSRHHAVVTIRDDRIIVDDLGSRNGTIVNGSRLTRSHRLEIGDRVQIGYTILEAR
ncbi:MAG: FHA domain-containing protein [Ilumatobacteraceae bacterium]